MKVGTLSRKEIKTAQINLSHYLLRFRSDSKLSQQECADMLGFSLSGYRSYERQTSDDNGILGAIQLLSRFSKLQEITVGELVDRLLVDQKRSENITEQRFFAKAWHKKMAEVLESKSKPAIRKEWSDLFFEFAKKENNINILLQTYSSVARIGNAAAISALKTVLDSRDA